MRLKILLALFACSLVCPLGSICQVQDKELEKSGLVLQDGKGGVLIPSQDGSKENEKTRLKLVQDKNDKRPCEKGDPKDGDHWNQEQDKFSKKRGCDPKDGGHGDWYVPSKEGYGPRDGKFAYKQGYYSYRLPPFPTDLKKRLQSYFED